MLEKKRQFDQPAYDYGIDVGPQENYTKNLELSFID